MGSSNASLIMTLVNSIIGVSILAMPFCYKQCGILLASLILIFSNLLTRLSCHYLLKSAIMTRRRTFELLAFHALGPAGKTVVEISIILLMIGTCIAFFVVMGDLSPPIIGSLLELKMTSALRPAVLLGLALFVVLPLGLLRNVDSLSSICTASFLFYLFLVFKVFIESTNNLFSGSWMDEVHFWRPAGILQCLPIFSMALSCQTQLLEVFDSAPNGTIDRMNSIVKSAVNLCTALYISVGFFGYIGYYKQSFSGNLLMSFSESYFSEFIKLGFVLSVAVTFPLVILPCRASLHSLLFKKAHVPHYELVTGGGNHIPEAHFKCITFFIITVSLIVGLLAPNIEIVLGLLGSTIGVIICFLCPPILFICISSKATTEKVLAQFLCAFGVFIMIMGTYANLYLSEPGNDIELQNWKPVGQDIVKVPVDVPLNPVPPKVDPPIEIKDIAAAGAGKEPPPLVKAQEPIDVAKKPALPADVPEDDKRVEPPVPEAPPKSKETAEQQVAAENVESKRVEPPVPIAPPGNGDKEAVPKEVSIENKRVESSAQVDSAAAVNKAAAAASSSSKPVVSPLPPKDSVKTNGDASIETVKKEPQVLPVAQKTQSNGEKRLLNEQKEIIQKMRGAKNQNAKVPAVKTMEKKVDSKEPSLDKRAPKSGAKKVDAAPVIKSEIREQKKMPLPLLVHSSAKGEDGSHAGEPPKREILGNVAPDREKRDLYYVTEGYRENQPVVGSKASVSLEAAAELKPTGVEPQDVSVAKQEATESKPAHEESEKRDSVAKQEAAESKSTPAEPHKDVMVANEKDKSVDEDLTCQKDSKSKATSTDSKVVSQKRSPDSNSKPAESVAEKVAEARGIKENEPVDSKKDDDFAAELFSRSHERKEAANAADDHNSDGLVIAPSKLSDPVVRLPESVPIDDKLKPALLSVMKPMSRELKTVEDKAETNKKK